MLQFHKQMASTWIQHCKEYQQKHGCTYKEAMIASKGSYKRPSQSVAEGTRLEQEKVEVKPIKKRGRKPTEKVIEKNPSQGFGEETPVESTQGFARERTRPEQRKNKKPVHRTKKQTNGQKNDATM